MAQHIYGIDLGSYLVKVAVIEMGFRHSELKRVVSVPVAEVELEPPPLPASGGADPEFGAAEEVAPDPEELRAAAQVEALRAALAKAGAPPDAAVVALSGDLATIRMLEFPFGDPRKVLSVLSYELEGQIPYDLDEVVFDQLISTNHQGGARAVVAMVQVERALKVLDRIGQADLDPGVLTLAPLCYGYLGDPATTPEEPAWAVLDIGHRRTNFSVLRGQHTLVARTLSRGGFHVTQGLADRYEVDLERAEELKHTYASLPRPDGPVTPADQLPVVEVVQAELAPMVRAVRQTLLGLKQTPELIPSRIVLCGGSSVIPGLREHLAEQLDVEVALNLPAAAPTGVGGRGQVLAVGLAQLQADRRLPSINLRQGPLAVKDEKSLLARKSLFIAWSLVAVLGLLVANGFASLWTLSKEEKQLRQKLVSKTGEILHKRMNDPEKADKKISRHLRTRKISTLPIPNSSAFAVLSEISRKVPGKKAVTLDVTRLYIREGKIDFEGTAKDPTEVSKVVEALKKITCFKKFVEGTTREVSVRELVGEELKTEKRSKFSVNITHQCM
jgi:general secretion pathway protein L